MIGSRYLRCTAVVAVALFSGTLVASYGAPATTSSAAVAAEHLAPIKIGVISTETSSTGQNTDGQVTAQRWQTYINSHGGIAGHPVEIIFKDDGDNPATAAQDFAELQQQGVIAIGDDSLVDSAFKSAADAAHIPVIGLGQSSASTLYGSDPNFFTGFGTVTANAYWTEAELAKQAHDKTMGFIYCSEIPLCAQASAGTAPFAEKMGIKASFKVAASSSAPNYTAQCLAAKDAGVDFLIVALLGSGGRNVVNDCAAQGYYPTVPLGGPNSGPAFIDNPNLHNAVGEAGTIPYFVKNEATAAFHKVMNSYIPHASSADTLMTTWVGLEIISEALAKVGAKTPTAADLYTGLYALKGTNLGGLTQTLHFVKGQPVKQSCAFYYSLINHKLVTPEGTKPVCPPANV